MYWLQINVERESDSGVVRTELRLPCPANELLSIVTAASGNDAAFSLYLHRALRTNPSLLIFTLACYRRDVGRAAKRPRELVKWCGDFLLAELALQTFEPVAENAQAAEGLGSKDALYDQTEWEGFLRARKHKKLKNALMAWLEGNRRLQKEMGLASPTTKQLNRALVKTLLAKTFRSDRFRCSGIRRRKTLNALQQSWLSARSTKVCFATLFQMAIKNRESDCDFERRVLVEKLAAMKELAYGASHEINNPLANIATRAQSLLQNESHPEKRHRIAVIYQQAMRAHEMISDMMLFAHPPAIEPKWVSARLLVSKFLRQLDTDSLDRDSIKVRVVVATGVDNVSLDPTHFLVALESLVKNSIEALQTKSSQGGEIEIRVTVRNGLFVVSVTDDGIGIEPRVARHLFDPFFSGREAGRGLGFGLCKVWRIAEMHGGKLRWDETCDTGTRFVFEIPVDVDSALKWQGRCLGDFEPVASADTEGEIVGAELPVSRACLRIA